MTCYSRAPEGCGDFGEVGIDGNKGQAVVLRSFADWPALENYVRGGRLPGTKKALLAGMIPAISKQVSIGIFFYLLVISTPYFHRSAH